MSGKIIRSMSIVAGLVIIAVMALVSMALEPQVHDTLAYSTMPETTRWVEEPKVVIEEEYPTDKSKQKKKSSEIFSMDWDGEEAYLLAKIAMAEAEGEDTEGKALVMLVVLNRVWDDAFPDTIERVIYQTKQFSSVSNGRFDEVDPDANCWAALDLIMLDKWDGSNKATYFESDSESTWHSNNLKFLFQHGNHYFYKER